MIFGFEPAVVLGDAESVLQHSDVKNSACLAANLLTVRGP